jgi:hypothetical protein
MEFYFAVSPFLPFKFPLSEKATESLMEAVLSNAVSYTPGNRPDLVRQNDPDGEYVVTAMSHLKEKSPWPDYQHEFILVFVQHTGQLGPATAPVAMKISRTIVGGAIPTRLGLWGPADDTVTVHHSPTTNNQDQCLQHFTWAPDAAPLLENISLMVFLVHLLMPQYCLFKTSCYTFARAVGDSTDRIFNGNVTGAQQLPFLMRQSFFLRCLPVGIPRAELIAAKVAGVYQAFRSPS